jgi:hypothetical protein
VRYVSNFLKTKRRREIYRTHRLCTLVSIAILPRLLEFGLPGSPLGTAKDMLLVPENCKRRSSNALSAPLSTYTAIPEVQALHRSLKQHTISTISEQHRAPPVTSTYNVHPKQDDHADAPQNDSHSHAHSAHTNAPSPQSKSSVRPL